MAQTVAIVDLFSGPGGLAEGFSACHGPAGQRRYEISLSVERETWAYRTLRLRAFLRKFECGPPPQYYDFLNGKTSEPDWSTLYPDQWKAACRETVQLELGPETTKLLRRRIDNLRNEYSGRTILLGGPPCQAHSIARRNGIPERGASLVRESRAKNLYQEFVGTLSLLRPAIAVMENVTGMLSSTVYGNRIIESVLEALRHPRHDLTYQLVALSPPAGWQYERDDLAPNDFIVRAEEHGIPQARHRLFIVCLRSDIADDLREEFLPRLAKREKKVALEDVIGKMPCLRSGLSRNDSYTEWINAVRDACELLQQNRPLMPHENLDEYLRALSLARKSTNGSAGILERQASGRSDLPSSCPSDLYDWIVDRKLEQLPNNETRGHMRTDIARYLFAAAFGRALQRSPRTTDFPKALIPDHRSWRTGHFTDRYRVQLMGNPSSTVTCHISKDGHHFIHPDPRQCRSLTVREVARLQTFPDNYFFMGGRTQQYVQVGNAVPPFLARQIAESLWQVIESNDLKCSHARTLQGKTPIPDSQATSLAAIHGP